MTAERYMDVYLVDIGEASDVSPLTANGLSTVTSWNEITLDDSPDPTDDLTSPCFFKTKMKWRWMPGTHEDFTLIAPFPGRWTHLIVTYTPMPYSRTNVQFVYRIDTAEHADSKLAPPTTWSSVYSPTVYRCTMDPLATVDMTVHTGGSFYTYTLTGHWNRYPEPVAAVREPFQVRPAQMKRSRSQQLASNIPDGLVLVKYAVIPIGQSSYYTEAAPHLLWCEVNYVDTNGLFASLGFFTTDTGQTYPMMIGGTNVYPSIMDVVNDPSGTLGVAVSSIVSLNISVRCPYACDTASATIAGDTCYYPVILDGDGNVMTPSSVGTSITNPNCTTYAFDTTFMMPVSYTDYITLTDKEIIMGQVRIYDVFGNAVGNIDTRYADTSTNRISYTMKTYSNGITMLSVVTLSDGTEIKFGEGTLPYNSNAYQEYAIAQMRYDRELLAMSQERVAVDTAMGLTGSIVNGAITGLASGGLGAVTGVMGAATTGIDAYVTYTQNERTQKAKEQLMKDTPDTVYNNSYGMEYFSRASGNNGFMAVNMPDGVSDAELTQYCYLNGYPVTDYYAAIVSTSLLTLAEGFMRCDHLNGYTDHYANYPVQGGPVCKGQLRRDLEQQLKQGVHFKVIT